MNDSVHLYLDLLKKAVSNAIYDDDMDALHGVFGVDPETDKYVSVQPAAVNPEMKYYGGIWPTRAHTMVGIPRLDNIQQCAEQVLSDGVPGDFIETGVWRGGASIFMRGILKAHGVTDRKVWVADSFEGLPEIDETSHYPGDANLRLHRFRDLAIPLEEVQKNFERYGLLDGQVEFLKGWFCDTLPSAPIEKLAIMRLDGDLYESTMDGLVNLYDKLEPGGFAIIDDYNAMEGCNGATDEFREREGITEPLVKIDWCGAYWRKRG